ncbi:MAG TPA: SDR family NAD(P)-dependent oxidoreductase [Myxococcaceae bacterium]|nr:SDR family NAD(P)-dependent oxidoreductase [Myxococcaceae bacterium]
MHILVTGASSGIGLGIARAFDSAGNRITLVARRRALLDELRAQFKCETQAIDADLSRTDDQVGWLKRAEETFGPTEILVNNAGASLLEPIDGIDEARADPLFQINLHTPIRAIHHVLPAMLARRSGIIVNVASGAAFMPAPYLCHYSATKAGLGSFSESLRMELKLKRCGVHVLTVYPGPIQTPMGDRNWAQLEQSKLAHLLMPTGNTETLARLVLRAVQRRRPRVIYPRFFLVGWWFPGLVRWATETFAPPATGAKTPPLPGDLRS